MFEELEKLMEENKDVLIRLKKGEPKKMWTTYWWGINDENSELYGEEFFTTLENADALDHKKYAQEIFPNEKLTCYGLISEEDAEIMGLDTY